MYEPKFWHGLFALAVGAGLFIGSAYTANMKAALWLQISGGAFWAYSIWVAARLSSDARTRLYNAAARYLAEVKTTPRELRDMVKILMPQAPFHWTGRNLVPMFEDSGAKMESVRIFLKESRNDLTPSKRNWTAAPLDRDEFENILNWFIENHYIIPDSANSNHSWRWYPTFWELAHKQYGGPLFLPELQGDNLSPVVQVSPELNKDGFGHAE
jgi:hypothetical protein